MIRIGQAAENMSALRRLALNPVKWEKSLKIGVEAKRKRAGWDLADLRAITPTSAIRCDCPDTPKKSSLHKMNPVLLFISSPLKGDESHDQPPHASLFHNEKSRPSAPTRAAGQLTKPHQNAALA